MQKSRPYRRIALIAVAIIIVVPVLAVAIFVATFNPNHYKPRIIAAVEQATGRTASITGKLRMSLSLVPTISATGITLANPPGFPDPNMATLKRIEAQVALLPLLSHRIDIVKLALIDPAIVLEYGPAGTPNWRFDSTANQPAAASRSGSPRAVHRSIALQSVSIQGGTVTYKPPAALIPLQGAPVAPAAPKILTITHFTGHAASPAARLHLSMQAQYDSTPFTLTGTTGPVSRLSGAGAPWPIDLTFGTGGATLHLAGSIAHPRHASGYALDIHAAIPNLASLDAYAGGIDLPPLKHVAFTGQIDQSAPNTETRPNTESKPNTETKLGTILPAITNVSLTAGQSDLGTWRKSLSVTSLDVTMASLDQPLDIAMAGQYQGKPIGLEGAAGPLGPILQAAFAPVGPHVATNAAPKPGTAAPANAIPNTTPRFAVNLAAKIGNARFGVAGGIARPTRLAGVALKITARIPDLAHLSDLAGRKLPSWTHIGLSGMLTDPGGQGLQRAIGLDSLAVSADQGQFGGAFTLRRGRTPDLQAVIDAPRIDLTALLKAMPPPAATTPGTTPQTAQTNGNTTANTTPASPQATTETLIPATPLPWNLLRQGDGNVELTIGTLSYDNATYDAITAHGLLRHGVLMIRPISAELPGGSVTGTLDANATANPPTIHVTEAAPAFRLAPLLTLLGLPDQASATVQLYGNLAGAGNTPRGIAATLNGTLGLSSVNGEIDGALLDRLFGRALASAGLPAGIVGAQGPVAVRCFAARLDSRNGLASVRALTLDSSRMYLTGTGSLDLGAERLNLILRPEVRVRGGSAPIPIAVSGTFAHPHEGIAPAGDYGGTAAALARQLGHNGGTVLGRIARRFGFAPRRADPQSCTGALALARLGHPGPMPATAAFTPNAPSGDGAAQGAGQGGAARSGPQNLLNSLLH